MATLEPKEELVLEYIKDNIRKKGYSPSIRDICMALDIKSTSTVHTCLDRLEKKGFILKENGKSRTLRVEGVSYEGSAGQFAGQFAGQLAGQNGQPVPAEQTEPQGVPILGRVTAGMPILAVENYEGYLTYPRGLNPVPEGELFALRVTGTSMIEVGIMDGDYVIVERTASADNGDIVVALMDDEATVKTFYKEDGHFRLQPENRTMLPIIVNSLMILGKVVASVRYYS